MSFPRPPHRKGPKAPPRLPLSAFTSPPNSGTSETFLPKSTSTFHPATVIDANVVVQSKDLDNTMKQWKIDMAEPFEKLGAVNAVVTFASGDLNEITEELKACKDHSEIVAAIIPFTLDKPDPAIEKLISESLIPISLSTVFTGSSPEAIAGLRWALERGRPVDIDIQATLSDSVLEAFEEMVTKATEYLSPAPPIILSNILPPPNDLDIPIVKLMRDPTYLAFQSQTAALSLFANVHIKYLPPVWNAPTPYTPLPGAETSSSETDIKQQKEWKRRIKMYLAPVMEAFGYERIVFGSSPSPSSISQSRAADWYEIARETLTELEVDQEFVDGVFEKNAKKVYAHSK